MIRPPSKETWAFALGLAVLVGGLSSRRFLNASDGVKNVSVTPTDFNFGKVRQGETLKHTFRLRNGGDVAIVVTKADSSCGCTTVKDLQGRVIPARGEVEVPVSLKTGIADGPESGRITLYFRSAAQADAPIHFALARVAADVEPDYRVRPTLIEFGKIEDAHPVTRTVRLRPEAQADVKIDRLFCTNESFSARQVAAPAGVRDLYVEVTFSGQSLWKTGPIEGITSIETSSTRNPIAQVLSRVQFVAPIEIEPASIVVGPDASGSVEREIRIVAARPVRIAALRSTEPAIRLAAIGPNEGRALKVRATISGDDPRHAINAEIAIDLAPTTGTDANEARTVKIPIHRLASKE